MTIATRLLAWYDREGRDLPWRKTRDPYRILVSEIMLQQTQVSRGLIFYARWLKRFPTWESLARASNADVLKAWAGLGYNRRALMLREIAKQVVERNVPSSEAEWRALKGIGPYTAAAISLFSQKQRTVPIDTNTRRVWARAFLGVPYPDPKDDGRVRVAAAKATPKTRHDDFVQATFDLATAICKKIPDCAVCPLRSQCKAAPKFLAGGVIAPKRMVKKAAEKKHRDKPYPDRIYRGRILKLARESRTGLTLSNIGPSVDPSFDRRQDAAWIAAMIVRLEKDDMVKKRDGRVFLA
jgi:A/G-specific adenine glycosylase